jgi:hypothetical protein
VARNEHDESVKDYYVYGAMAFEEFIPETQRFESESFPINTRMEVYDYDYPLYWALSGIHGKWCYWAGKGAGQTSSGSTDDPKSILRGGGEISRTISAFPKRPTAQRV